MEEQAGVLGDTVAVFRIDTDVDADTVPSRPALQAA